ncbi:cyclic nucleotide-binding protein [Chloroherpeton thalassium ATCC 35110]|uniref:Cyclic nucleotide-binding protein n=1 Tax=Chloroherpeton thalassium (strain ATCC 35110 / GB-78) TaxID=517418 RepID=B3QVZ0_CHLT3|nr:cyclic nucleotide-binding domain-containing protein [Chloroherpeton thalassium]ACF14644.1 cyclic nucleotide-binding protein [Chloroherpeton thalassium ATCC 35110]
MPKIDPSNIPIFAGISPEEMDQIIKYAFVKNFDPGYILFRENLIVGQIMYVILSGKVELSKKNPNGEDVAFLTLGPGALLGEMSLFEQQKRSATAIVKEYSELLVLPKYNFDRMLQSRPNEAIKILLNFITILSQRLRDTTNKMIQAQDQALDESDAAMMSADTAPHPVGFSGKQRHTQNHIPDPEEKIHDQEIQKQAEQVSDIPQINEADKSKKNNELYILSIDEIKSGNLVSILEDKRRKGFTIDNNTRLLMIRDILNYYLQLPMEELQLKVREMELRFRNRPK